MRLTSFTICFLLGCTMLIQPQQPFSQPASLFAIVENNKTGYIDKEGRIALPAVYAGGGEFSEGLAPVRLKGRYGFIDAGGFFVIDPQFDFALPFMDGWAIVYKDGHPYYIDHQGHPPFACHYAAITSYKHGLAAVRAQSGKWGFINRAGKLIIDTLYSNVGDFNNGLAVASIRTEKEEWLAAVIDTTGHIIVPPGTYREIKDFNEGYAVVEIDDETTGVIDRTGRLLFSRPFKDNIFINASSFSQGIGTINLHKDGDYTGFIDLHGNILLDDPAIKDAVAFSNGRAFIRRENEGYRMIDTHMKPVGTEEYTAVKSRGFVNGYAIVKKGTDWGLIDTNAHFVAQPDYADIEECGIVNGYFFFSAWQDNKTLYGVADLHGREISSACLEDLDRTGFTNGLLKVVVHGRLAFLDTAGRIVWQADTVHSTALSNLNIDYMMRGYFYAYSSPEKNEQESSGGGWAISGNIPQKLHDLPAKDPSLKITIDPHTIDTFARSFNGFRAYVTNTTKDTFRFHAQDSRLYMKMQAQDEKGNWKDIDYLPGSWCGNSYHTIALEPEAQWKFVIPRFEGEVPTKLRIMLQYIDPLHSGTDKVLYSNLIDGRINPAQFWNKRRYYPQGIMDPYND